jgi:uncharacterized protein YjbI with pentapeptide repeats
MTKQEQYNLLKRGVQEWDQWRIEHPRLRPDLSGADLRAADLSDADLHGVNLSGATLIGANLSQANLRPSIVNP